MRKVRPRKYPGPKAPRVVETDALVNDLFRRMPAAEWVLLKPHLKIVSLAYGQVLFEDREPSDMAYFPMTAVISMLALMKNGDEVEYGSIGREGMVGLQVALDAQPLRGRAMCQLEGEAVILAREDMIKLTQESTPQLHRLLMRYAQSTINVLAQSAACNALHPLRERMARWLLMTSDRAGQGEFPLTQEFLSLMIGVRRAGINEVARKFKRDKIIKYTRGQVTILDRKTLEASSCECYGFIRDEYAMVVE
jgi:CRP-like cAMP-binding protein